MKEYKKLLSGIGKILQNRMRYKLAEKVIDEKDLEALALWLATNAQLTKGPLTLQFEKLWADWVGTRYAVFCNSGSSANLLAAYAMLISSSSQLKNKKVIVPAVGWVTTIAPFIQFGFEPIMCGADPENFGLDLLELETLLQKYDPAVVVYVQALGVPGDMDKLLALREKYGFLLLEDACAALGAEYDGQKVGSFGDMSTFSFFFGHQLSTIEGGMINTDSKEFYDLLLMLRSHGWGKDLDDKTRSGLMEKHAIDPWHEPFTFFVPGFNVRSTDLNAFLGIRQMQKADKVISTRRQNHLTYTQNLKTVQTQKAHSKAAACSISLGAIAKSPEHRRRIVKKLDEQGIETRLFSAGNLGRHPFWQKLYGEFRDPVADQIHDCGFFLPNNESLNEKDIKFICEAVNNVQPI